MAALIGLAMWNSTSETVEVEFRLFGKAMIGELWERNGGAWAVLMAYSSGRYHIVAGVKQVCKRVGES
ncbi:hypothetical protein [Vacuolonema iberomarrocanum]|uniref:hypothetical protein n=1 Tax=Vacuolonema iberomarrocanum TaxID=3454632 RepID=UPI003F6DEEAF